MRKFFSDIILLPGILCFVLILFINAANCQPTLPSLQVGVLAGYNQARIIDKGFSAKTFAGSGFGVTGTVQYDKYRHQNILDIHYSQSTPSISSDKQYNVKLMYGSLDYSHLYSLIDKRKGFNFAAGGEVSAFYSDRKFEGFLNRSKSHEFAASFGPVAGISYLFNDKLTGITISDRLFVPLASIVNRPGFDEDYNRTEFGSFSTLLKLKNKLWIEKNIAPAGKLVIYYLWDFYRIDKIPQVMQANHQAGIGYFITF